MCVCVFVCICVVTSEKPSATNYVCAVVVGVVVVYKANTMPHLQQKRIHCNSRYNGIAANKKSASVAVCEHLSPASTDRHVPIFTSNLNI